MRYPQKCSLFKIPFHLRPFVFLQGFSMLKNVTYLVWFTQTSTIIPHFDKFSLSSRKNVSCLFSFRCSLNQKVFLFLWLFYAFLLAWLVLSALFHLFISLIPRLRQWYYSEIQFNDDFGQTDKITNVVDYFCFVEIKRRCHKRIFQEFMDLYIDDLRQNAIKDKVIY